MKNIWFCVSSFTLSLGLFVWGLFWLSLQDEVWVMSFSAAFLSISVWFFILSLKNLKNNKKDKNKIIVAFVSVVLFSIGLSWWSDKSTMNEYLRDYSVFNDSFKKALYSTGQNDVEAPNLLRELNRQFFLFKEEYTDYLPLRLRLGDEYGRLINMVDLDISLALTLSADNRNDEAHKKLEQVREKLNTFFKSVNISSFSISLVDFHDQMEKLIDYANNGDLAQIITSYQVADTSLTEVETLSGTNDLLEVRKAFEDFIKSAREGRLEDTKDKAKKMKSEFIKVYLSRG